MSNESHARYPNSASPALSHWYNALCSHMRQRERERDREEGGRERSQKCLNPNTFANISLACSSHISLTVTDLSHAFESANKFTGEDLWVWDVRAVRQGGTFSHFFGGSLSSLSNCNKKRIGSAWADVVGGKPNSWTDLVCAPSTVITYSDIKRAAWDWINFGKANATKIWGAIEDWDTSRVNSLFALFSESRVGSKAQEWSGADLTKWDTGNVESFVQMFKGNSKFNGSVSTFQIQKATHLSEMFRGCASFNGGLGTWDVSKVVNTYSMFRDASKFVSVKSQDIPYLVTPTLAHNASSRTHAPKTVANSFLLLSHLSHYLQQVGTGLSKWKTGSLTNMEQMFEDARLFNGDVSSFNTEGEVL